MNNTKRIHFITYWKEQKKTDCVSKGDETKPAPDSINTLSLEGMEVSCNHEPNKNF
jgi:hypothetical protein